MGSDQGDDQAGHEQHVDRVEAGQRRPSELGAATQEVGQVGADQRPGAGDVHAHHRGPEGALVERQEVAREAHHHGQDQQHDADHPVELARVLVGAEDEGARHVEPDQDDHHAGAPLVHAAHELAEEDVVRQVGDRRVGLGRGRRVVHRQEDAGHRLHGEREQRRRAQRVEPVGALRNLPVEHSGEEAGPAGALVDPTDQVGGRFLETLRRAGAVAVARLLRLLERAGDEHVGELHLILTMARARCRAAADRGCSRSRPCTRPDRGNGPARAAR